MKALIDLFSTDYGIMSVIVIAIILIMAGYFTWLFTRLPAAPASDTKK